MKRNLNWTSALSCVMTASLAATSAVAADEIIVTAQKREQGIGDVPIAISAYSGDEIRERGLSSVTELARQNPSVLVGVGTGEGGVPLIAIRGVSLQDYSDINEGPSAVYIDEFYKASLFAVDAQLYDLERVEVLRGPQGTLFGRNATGGLIQVVTAKPTDTPEGYIQAGFGEWDQYRIEGAVGGPITENLSGRFSLARETFDGYSENLFDGPDGNFVDTFSLRGQLLYEPTDAFSASLMYQYSQNRGENAFTNLAVTLDPDTQLAVVNPGGADAAGYVDPTPNNLADINIDEPGFLNTDQHTAIGRIEWDLGGVTLISVTGYEHSSKDLCLDTDASPTFVRETSFSPVSEEISQEVRLEGGDESFYWVLGGFYFDFDIDGMQDLNGVSFVSSSYMPMDYAVDTTSWAVFANASYSFAPTLSLDLGARYTEEDKEISIDIPFTFVYDSEGAFAGFGSFLFDESTVGDLAKHDVENFSFNARLNWTPTEDLLAYAGVSRGFKGGAFNLGLFALPLVEDYKVKEEKLTSYEAGLKTSMHDGRFQLNGAIFYYDYVDFQAFLYDSATRSSLIFNTDATIKGLELEGVAQLFEGFDLTASLTLLDATLDDVADRAGNIADRDMALAPDVSASVLARYSWAAPWGGSFAVQSDVIYRSEHYFDPLNSPALHEPSYVVVDARVSWTNEAENWEIALIGKNIGDKTYRNYAFDFSSQLYIQGMYARPQWFGGTVSYRF